jgi:hypothetical protein
VKKTEAKFIVPDWGEKVDSGGIGLSYRPSSLVDSGIGLSYRPARMYTVYPASLYIIQTGYGKPF